MRTLATLLFIGAVAAGALVMATRETRLEGDVIAADLLGQLREKGITEMKCEDSMIGNAGARFRCFVWASDGSSATIEYTIDRNGAYGAEQVPD